MVGYEDLTLGHVSARGSDDQTIYIKRKGVALGEVTPGGRPRRRPRRRPRPRGGDGMHLETVLHTEVYKRRPDVRSVVHGHPAYATAFGATDAEFAYLTHDSVLFVGGHLDLRRRPRPDHGSAPGSRGRARRSATGTALLLRNHGVLVAERDVRWAVLASALLERAMQMQLIATSLGPLHPIPEPLLEGIHAVQVPGRLRRRVLGRVDPRAASPRTRVRHAREPADGPVALDASTAATAISSRSVEPQELLLDFLRERLGLTGAKRSCDVQVCGTCTVLVDGGPVSACTYLAAEARRAVRY